MKIGSFKKYWTKEKKVKRKKGLSNLPQSRREKSARYRSLRKRVKPVGQEVKKWIWRGHYSRRCHRDTYIYSRRRHRDTYIYSRRRHRDTYIYSRRRHRDTYIYSRRRDRNTYIYSRRRHPIHIFILGVVIKRQYERQRSPIVTGVKKERRRKKTAIYTKTKTDNVSS